MLTRTGIVLNALGIETPRFTCECGENDIGPEGFKDFSCYRCGRVYECGGALLADRSQWGEETGETANEIYGPSGPERW